MSAMSALIDILTEVFTQDYRQLANDFVALQT